MHAVHKIADIPIVKYFGFFTEYRVPTAVYKTNVSLQHPPVLDALFLLDYFKLSEQFKAKL